MNKKDKYHMAVSVGMTNSYPAFPEPDDPLHNIDILEDSDRHCPGVVADIDPEWNPDDVVNFNMMVECDQELKGISADGAWKGIDEGLRPVLYDVNRHIGFTTESNIMCSGTAFAGQPWLRFDDGVPQFVINSINEEAPEGWTAITTDNRNQVDLVPDDCADFDEFFDPANCEFHEMEPSEFLEADQGFVRGLRKAVDRS